MIRRVLGRLLRVAPPTWAVSACILIFLVFEGPAWYLKWKWGLVDLPKRPGVMVLSFASFALGLYRVLAFHPYFRPPYLRWLKGTPWTVRKPLPLGPVELVPEDCLAICLLALLGKSLPDFTSLYIINLFLFAHTLAITTSLWKTGSSVYGYCAIFLLGFVPQFWQAPWVDFGILAVTYLMVHEGLWRTMCRFPWETEGFWRDMGIVTAPRETAANTSCGWAFDRFFRDIREAKGVNRVDALLGSMLGGWWFFSLVSLLTDPRDRHMVCTMGFTLAARFSAGARWFIYARGCRPPISFWGRVCTLRWIVPGYDQLFVGPICSVLGAFLVLSLMAYRSIPVEVACPAAAGVALVLALISPPSLRRFRLTGHHRLAATFSEAQAARITANQ